MTLQVPPSGLPVASGAMVDPFGRQVTYLRMYEVTLDNWRASGNARSGTEFAPGDRTLEAILRVENRRLWELNDPFLYRVTARLQAAHTNSVDERSTRCGFRDFRFEDGYFRLNGRRIRLHGPLYTVLQYPIAQIIPHDEELLRADVLNTKAMGFNIVRITCGPSLPRQLDIFDEVGLLAFEEHYGARFVEESPAMAERWDQSLAAVVRRDRNHPSIVMWGMLNEVSDGALFRHAVDSLELLRGLDEDRVVMLNSGRFDRAFSIGSFSNPGSRKWESGLRDVHAYPLFPHTAEIIRGVRSPGLEEMPGTQPGSDDTEPLFLTEYGVCGGQDYPRFLRNFERLGKDSAPDARLFREKLDRFLPDWEKWHMEECWARPEDYFAESQRNQAKLALDDFNVWLSNPALIGDLTSTQITDAWFHGCGITNYFRELKPGMADAYNDMAARTRWCLFVEPVNVYRGAKVRLEAVLVNQDDVLKPGRYPARLQVVAPNMKLLFDRTVDVAIADSTRKPEPPFVQPVLTEEITLDGPSGKYRFLATFQRGIPAGGGQTEFYAADPAEMPAVPGKVLVWGEDRELLSWCGKQGISARPFDPGKQAGREVIVASGIPPGQDLPQAFAELARHVARGSTVIFLTLFHSGRSWSGGENHSCLASGCRLSPCVGRRFPWPPNHRLATFLPGIFAPIIGRKLTRFSMDCPAVEFLITLFTGKYLARGSSPGFSLRSKQSAARLIQARATTRSCWFPCIIWAKAASF